MVDEVWVDMDSAIQKQLDLQVELSLSRHHAFMVKHGLNSCATVVDLGTGNGDFLSEIAGLHSEIKFIGVDNKPHMIDIARRREQSNVEWIQADALDSQTMLLLESADGILMRYFVLHLPSTGISIKRMLASVRPGTQLWLIDLDTDYCSCIPPSDPFSGFVHLVKAYCQLNAVEIKTSAQMPPILESCGFEMTDIEVEPFNNHKIDPNRFGEYLLREATLYHYSLYGTSGTHELKPLRDFLEKITESGQSQFVQYGMVMSRSEATPLTKC